MASYEDFISKVKTMDSGTDFDRMYSMIGKKRAIDSRHAFEIKLAASGFLLFLLIGTAVLINSGIFLGKEDYLPGYIYQTENTNGDSVMNYVY